MILIKFDDKSVSIDERCRIEIEYKNKKYVLIVTRNDGLLLNKK